MTPYVVLGLILGLPLLLGVMFRVSVSHLFFSLMAGELLARYFGEDIGEMVLNSSSNRLLADYVEVGIIVLPVLLTAFFLRSSISRGKVVFHFAPLVITGIVFASFVLPVLPGDLQAQVRSIEAGRQLLEVSSVIVGGVVVLQLAALWILHGGKREGKHKKRH